MANKDKLYRQLGQVIDPELGINIVDLGLVYEAKLEGSRAKVLMTLTTPGCPLAGVFDELVSASLKELDGVDQVSVELTFDPPWTKDMMSDEAKAQLGMD